MTPKVDEAFYREKSWGAVPIRAARDIPTLKLNNLIALLQRRTRPDANLLEIGCGSGRILSSIRARDADIQLTGVDQSQEQIELARAAHEGRRIEFVWGNGEALPFADASFDYAVVFDCLEHVDHPRDTLAEISRVMNPGARLHLVCPAERQSIYRLSTWLFRRHFKAATAGHIQQYTRREIAAMVQGAGLVIEDEMFSYHFLGSLLDYTLFVLMLHPAIYRKFWTQNQYYARSEAKVGASFFNFLLRTGNAIVYYESLLLRHVRFGATAVHLTARKPG